MKAPLFPTLLTTVFLSAITASILLSGSQAFCQVNGNGPSDPSLFDNVINIPDDPDIGDQQSIGGDSQTTQLNLSDGGSIGDLFEVRSGAELNLSGGTVGRPIEPQSRSIFAGQGSELNISGGTINFVLVENNVTNISGGSIATFSNNGGLVDIEGGNFGYNFNDMSSFFVSGAPLSNSSGVVNISGGNFDGGDFSSGGGVSVPRGSDAELNISGGVFGNGVDFRNGNVELFGGEYKLNGQAYGARTISLTDGDVLTGVFADGSAFVFSSNDSGTDDLLTDVKLRRVALPTPVSNNFVIDSPESPETISSLRDGQSLKVTENGSFGKTFESVGGDIDVAGGSLGDVTAYQGSVEMSSGSIRSVTGFESLLKVTGGQIRKISLDSSQADISGGVISNSPLLSSDVLIRNGSVLNVSGGSVDERVLVSDSEVNISGNAILDEIDAESSQVNTSGGDISLLNTDGGTLNITGGSVRLARTFRTQIEMDGGSIGLSSNVNGNSSVGMSLLDGVIGRSFSVENLISFDISGGEIGRLLSVRNSTMNLSDGKIGDEFTLTNSVANITGGIIGDDFKTETRSVVTMSDGQIGNGFEIGTFGIANISGGQIEDDFIARNGSTVNITGGIFGDDFRVLEGGNVNLFGSNFVLNGLSLDDDFCSGEAFTLRNRNGTLSGLLADGSPFSFVLNNFHPDATVTLNFVPEPILQLVDGNIIIMMTRMPDEITVTQDSNQLEVNVNNVCETFEFAEINRIVIFGFGGIDLIQIDARVETTIHGGGGDDMIFGGKLSAEIFGGPGRDLIVGGPASDFLDGGRGDDVVEGLAGNDQLFGRAGRDVLSGGAGNDELFGGLGGDILSGGNGNDLLVGSAGADTLNGNGGDDELIGFGGPDKILGGPGDDDLSGGAGFDTMDGGSGIDAALDKGEVEIGIENS